MPDINNIKSNFERTLRDVTISLKEESATEFQRNTKLPPYALLRLLIGAEGGALAKIAYQAGINVTPAAISQRRAQIFRQRCSVSAEEVEKNIQNAPCTLGFSVTLPYAAENCSFPTSDG